MAPRTCYTLPVLKREAHFLALLPLLGAAALFYAVFIGRTSFILHGERYFTLIDDAMISMRYARHLAQGYGWTWNIGAKPVEGFTNPGWTLLMAFLHLFPFPASKISLAVMIVSACILLVHGMVMFRIGQRLAGPTAWAPWLAVFIMAFYFPLVFWSLRGMEVGLLALLMAWAVRLALEAAEDPKRKAGLLALVFSLGLLVRLDMLVPLTIITGYLFFHFRSAARPFLLPLLALVLTTLTILGLQRLYFGDFLPNTYYQKVSGFSTWVRIKYGLLAFRDHALRDTLLMGLLALIGLARYKDLRRRENLLLGGIFVGQCAYSVWVGGDYAEVEVDAANRFISLGMPALILLSSLAIERFVSDLVPARPSRAHLARGLRAALLLGAAAAVLLSASGQPWLRWQRENAPLLRADIRRVKLGLFIAQNTSPEAVIAVHAAGQIPYYSERTVVDLLGLNDPLVAKGPPAGNFYPGHDKWNYEYSILQLKPDLIADNWDKLADFMRGRDEYQKLENGIYVRRDSTRVDFSGISREYR